jgi:Spy/CpxP family protein refolding chaperone
MEAETTAAPNRKLKFERRNEMEGNEEVKEETKRHRCRRKSRFHKLLFVILPIGLIAALGVYGLSYGHGRGWKDPERLEKKMNWVAEDVADELEIRPDQQEAYQALVEKFKAHIRDRVAGWREAGTELKDEFNKETPDADNVAALLKQRIRERASSEELEALVDQGVGFYKTLSPEQQATFKEKVGKHLNRHL